MWKDEESGRFTLTEGFEEDSIFMGSNMSSTSLEVGLFKCSLIFFSMLPPLDNIGIRGEDTAPFLGQILSFRYFDRFFGGNRLE